MTWTLKLPGWADITLSDPTGDYKNSMYHARSDEVVCLHMEDSSSSGGDEGRAWVWLTKEEVRTLSEKLKEWL